LNAWRLAPDPYFAEAGNTGNFVEVTRVVLDDDGRPGARHDLLGAVERSQRLGAIGVERGYAVGVIIFAGSYETVAEVRETLEEQGIDIDQVLLSDARDKR
jgi:hypothetical protein